MPNASGYLKRGQPALYPHEITVIEDSKHPLYDPRIENPISDDRIRNIVMVGQIVPVSIRIEEDDAILVDGRGRWKIGTVINHVVGVKSYTGKLACVREAIARLKGTELEKLIVDRCAPLGIKLAFTVRRGTMDDAVSGMVSANEQRDDDPKEAKIRRAQRISGLNHPAETIAIDMGQTVSTIKRWLKVDIDKPREKKTRGKAARPGKRLVDSVISTLGDPKIGTLIGWIRGEATDEQLLAFCPELGEALAAKTKKAA